MEALGNGHVQELLRGGPAALSPVTFAAVSGGAALALPYKMEMEAAFGQSFDGVSAFHDASAVLGASGVEAASQGDTVVFSSANPPKETVAHELAHVAQRRDPATRAAGIASSEEEADKVAAAACAGEEVSGLRHAPAAVAAKKGDPVDPKASQLAALVQSNSEMFESEGYSSEKDGSIAAAVLMNENKPNGYRTGLEKNFNFWAIQGGGGHHNGVQQQVDAKVSEYADLFEDDPAKGKKKNEKLPSKEKQAEYAAFRQAVEDGKVSKDDITTLNSEDASEEEKARAMDRLRGYVVQNTSSEAILGKLSPGDPGYEMYARKKWILDQAKADPGTASNLMTLMSSDASVEEKLEAQSQMTNLGVEYRVHQYERLKELESKDPKPHSKGKKDEGDDDASELQFLKGLKLSELHNSQTGADYTLEDLQGLSSDRLREIYAPGTTRFEPAKYKQMKAHYKNFLAAKQSKQPATADTVKMDEKDPILMKDVIGGHEAELDQGQYDYLADLSTSYTSAQIMGFNVATGKLKKPGSQDAYNIADLKQASVDDTPTANSLGIVLSYLKNFTRYTNSASLRNKQGQFDYDGIADAYNGSASEVNDYSGRLKQNVEIYNQALKASKTPPVSAPTTPADVKIAAPQGKQET